ncbi:MAG: tetratricopeptide repeat protein [Candidatus Hodarchaeales archaeon]
MVLNYIYQFFKYIKGNNAQKVKQIEELARTGNLEDLLEEIDNIGTKLKLEEEDELRSQILKSHILTHMGAYREGFSLAEKIIKEGRRFRNQLMKVDAIVPKITALLMLGELDESIDAIDEGMDLLHSLIDIPKTDILEREANFKHLKGMFYRIKGDLYLALENLNDSLSIRQEIGNPYDIAESMNSIGIIHASKNEINEALYFWNESLNLSEKIGSMHLSSKLLNNLGMIYWQKGELDQALRYYHESLSIYQKLGDKQRIASSLSNIGLIFWNKGELDFALDYYRGSLSLFEEIENEPIIASVLNNIGIIHENKGELDIALHFHLSSLSIRQELDNKYDIAMSFNNIGSIYFFKGISRTAKSFLKKSVDLFEETGNIQDASDPLYNLIRVSVHEDSLEEAESHLRKLQVINKEEENKFVDQVYRISKALILKSSERLVKRAEAQAIFQNIVEEEVIRFELTIEAMINLCELLLLELKGSGSREVLDEVKELLNRLIELARAKHSHSWLSYAFLLQSKLAMLELDIETAQQFLTKAQLIAEEKGLHKLELTISSERDLLYSQLSKWEKIIEQKPSMREIIQLTQFDDLIERMVRKRLFRDEEEINEYAKDVKQLFDRWEK